MAGVMNPFLVEVLSTPGGADVLQCYQCGTCSGSCPVVEEMTYGPRRLMHMIQAGMRDEVLSSPDMWFCVSCYSCANRCPRGIEITDLMAELRCMAQAQGYAVDREAEFGEAFAETITRHGRLFEPELMARYYLRVLDVFELLRMAPMGLAMILKGKLPFRPEPIENREDLERICVPTDPKPPKLSVGTLLTKAAKKRKMGAGLLVGPLMLIGALLTALGGLGGLLLFGGGKE